MSGYILRRLVQAVPTFFGITILSFFLMSLTPGGPIGALAYQSGRTTVEQRQRLEARLGVNDPIPVQYLRWLLGDDWMRRDTTGDGVADWAVLIPLDATGDGEPEPPGTRRGILRGDFGNSFFNNRPVLQVLGERLPATLELSVSALLVGLIVGLAIGILSAVYRGGWFDNVMRVVAVIVNSVPNFWLGLILLFFLAYQFQIFPLGGRCRATLADTCPPIFERIEYMVLPVIVLSAAGVALFSRFMRAAMLDVVGQDYIRTAKAKGLPDRRVWTRHAMRNALIPIATFLGPAITGLLGGAVITEFVFSYPGVGLTAVQAFTQRDYPIVMAVTIYAALATIVGYLISDVLYSIIDPRIRMN
jgi:peptide/nickel transport system permease protein